MRKVFWFDLETTGVDEKQCAIIQLAGLIEINGEVIEEINLKAKPHEGALISDEALRVTGITKETLASYPSHETMYLSLTRSLCNYVNKFDKNDKFVIAGYNVNFDDRFLRELFTRCFDKFYGSLIAWPKIDVTNLIAEEYAKGLRLINFQLGTLCSHYGIPLKAHDALGDIKATRTLYYTLKEATSI